jgi:hypothetical protein
MLAVDSVRALPPPHGVSEAQTSADEVLRLWIIDRKDLAATFPPGLYGEDVWKWGRLLANVARYVAQAHGARTGEDVGDVLDAIRLNFDEEAKRQTPPPNGELRLNDQA